MSWTEGGIIKEFDRHIQYWQAKLRLKDLSFSLRVTDDISDDPDAWCSVKRENCGANPHVVDFRIRRSSLDASFATPYEIWVTVAHELIHVMNWPMAYAFNSLTDHFSVSQLNMAKALMKGGNEEIAYKWEGLLADWFSMDAPSKELPAADSSATLKSSV